MNREIKFRFYSQHGETGRWSIVERTLEDIEDSDSWQGGTGGWQRIAVCQLTGLKDSDGCEIYEGDVLGYEYPAGFSRCEVKFGEYVLSLSEYDTGGVGWYIEDWHFYNENNNTKAAEPEIHSLSPNEYPLDSYKFKVIGNIYENPELLTSNNHEQVEG